MVSKLTCRRCHKIAEAPEGRLPDGWWYTKLDMELSQSRGKPTCQDCLGTAGPDRFHIVNRRELYKTKVMKLFHAAALALVGWYLMVPSQLSKWSPT